MFLRSPQPPDSEDWEPITNTSMHVLYISGGAEIQKQVTLSKEQSVGKRLSARTEFWSKIYNKYYEPPKALSCASSLLGLAVAVTVTQIVLKIL